MFDRDDVAGPAVAQVNRDRLSEQVIHIAVEQDQVGRADRHMQTLAHRLIRPAAKPFKFSIHRYLEFRVQGSKFKVGSMADS